MPTDTNTLEAFIKKGQRMAVSVDAAVRRVCATPPFPIGSDKRGIDRAIEIVQWQKLYAEARAIESRARGAVGLANVWDGNALAYEATLRLLKDEAGR